MKICLDAGHYGNYNRSPANPEYYESQMTWKLHNLLAKYLREYGVEIVFTRKTQNIDLEVSARGRIAEGCDLLISVHSNAVGNFVNDLVDYPVAYVPLNGSANDLGRKLAECVQKTMNTVEHGRIATRQGNNGDYYGIIRGAVSVGVPCIIVEHSFHTNTKSTAWLMNEKNLDIMAKAEAAVIAEHYGLKMPSVEKPAIVAGIYCVNSGDGFLNLRAGNGVEFPVVEEMKSNSLVCVLGDSGNGWFAVCSMSGIFGYCNGAYLKRVEV